VSTLKCKIEKQEWSLSSAYCTEDEFSEIGADGIRELIKEDVLGFIDELGGIDALLDHLEFYWRD
jgi:hypothetical protein